MPSVSKVFTWTHGIFSVDATLIINIDSVYRCNGELYKSTPKALGSYKVRNQNVHQTCDISSVSIYPERSYFNSRVAISLADIQTRGFMELRGNPNQSPDSVGVFSLLFGTERGFYPIPTEPSTSAEYPNSVLSPKDSRVSEVYTWTIQTNFPIFETNAQRDTYISSGTGLENAVNWYQEQIEGDEFSITNIWTHGTWTEYGHTPDSSVNHRDVRGRITSGGKMALYPIAGVDNGALKMAITHNGTYQGLQYSLDGVTWINTEEFPFEFFYREHDNEIGEFDYSLTLSSNTSQQYILPIFEDEDDANEYLNGTKDISDATNWNIISLRSDNILNGTGASDDITEFGEVYTRAFFSQQYICTTGNLSEIANGLYDTSQGGIFENIKRGVEMFGQSPIDSVFSLVYYPFDLATVFTNTASSNHIYFGGYKFDLQNGNVLKILTPNGYKDLGTFIIKPTFKNYRDYEPYSKLRVYLPYVGWHELDIKRYIGKTVKVRYYIDTRTNGTCVACLIADGLLTDYFTGQIGVSMPMTLTDFSNYANSQIQTLLGGNIGGVAGMISPDLATQGGASATMGIAMAEVGMAVNLGKTAYKLGQNNINNFNATKGCSTSMINAYLPQEVLFEFEIQELDDTANSAELRGYPSNASGQINNFSGYLEVQEVKLKCQGATESEKNEIIQLLNNGIYI